MNKCPENACCSSASRVFCSSLLPQCKQVTCGNQTGADTLPQQAAHPPACRQPRWILMQWAHVHVLIAEAQKMRTAERRFFIHVDVLLDFVSELGSTCSVSKPFRNRAISSFVSLDQSSAAAESGLPLSRLVNLCLPQPLVSVSHSCF